MTLFSTALETPRQLIISRSISAHLELILTFSPCLQRWESRLSVKWPLEVPTRLFNLTNPSLEVLSTWDCPQTHYVAKNNLRTTPKAQVLGFQGLPPPVYVVYTRQVLYQLSTYKHMLCFTKKQNGPLPVPLKWCPPAKKILQPGKQISWWSACYPGIMTGVQSPAPM